MARDTAQARKHMVDGPLRPNRVTDPRLVAAMLAIPREDFLPPGLAPRAYTDEDVPLPGGRALIEPMVIARLLQLLALRNGDRLLILGAGTGYAAAVAAACGAWRTTLPSLPLPAPRFPGTPTRRRCGSSKRQSRPATHPAHPMRRS